MHWVIWLMGIVVYYFYRESNIDFFSWKFWGLVLILMMFSAVGEGIERERKRREQKNRDDEAERLASELQSELKKNSGTERDGNNDK